MTKAELEARNLSLGQLMMMMPENENDVFARELQHRLIVACKIAVRLEDSLFYARMYRDTCDEGRARRGEMIDDAVDLISVFRNGGIYP
jgi:hypothetical protein